MMIEVPGVTWSDEELRRIDAVTELYLASNRGDGSIRPFVTIWVVRVGADVYVRSAHGTDRPWFRRARASGAGRIRAGDIERDVLITEPTHDAACHDRIDTAYRAKYGYFGARMVDNFVGPDAIAATLRLTPR